MRDPLIIAGATGYGVWPANSLAGEIAAMTSLRVDTLTVSGPDWSA